MAVVYNAQETDAAYGVPPALGFDLLTGASASSYFVGGGPPGTSDPSTGEAMYNFMQGLWGDGSPMRANGDGYNQPTTFPVTRYVFTGDPVDGGVLERGEQRRERDGQRRWGTVGC